MTVKMNISCKKCTLLVILLHFPGFNGSHPLCCDIIILAYIGKAVPLQAWSGPEGSRKLRFPDFVTTAQDGGKVVSLTHLPPLPPGNAPGTHFCSRLAYIYIYIYIYICI